MAAATAALIAGLALSAASTTYGVVKTEQAHGEAQQAAADQKQEAANLKVQADNTSAAQKAQTQADSQAASARQAAIIQSNNFSRSNLGRQGTILGNALGLPGDTGAAAPRKTLLGQ